MGLTTKSLGELLEYVDRSRLQLPEIQRDFVWQKRNVKMLFDSLYRGLPIGQMLVWNPPRAFPGKSFRGQRRRRAPGSVDSFYGYLLDGQQRLTAISRVREADPEFPLMFDLWPDNDDAEYLKAPFYWDHSWDDSSPWYVAVSDVLGKDFNITAHLDRLEADDDFKAHDAEPIRKKLTQLQSILNYPISVIEFDRDDYKAATELFIRFNSTGRKLNRSDLVLAELAMRVDDLASKEMGKLLAKLAPEFQFTRPFLIQCLTAVHTGRLSHTTPQQVFGSSTAGEIMASWERTTRGVEAAVNFLTETVRWDSGAWLPSFNALIPLVYVFSRKHVIGLANRELARTWILATTMHAQFSGSVYTELDRILRRLEVKPTIEMLWDTTPKRNRKITYDLLDTTRRSGPVMSLFMSIWRNDNARDWVAGTPLDGKVIGQEAKLHVHHFFPKALLNKHGYDYGWANTFANLTVLRASTNLDIGMEEPSTYLDRIEFDEHELKKQFIPIDRKLWHVENYEKFVDARLRLLTEGANAFLGV